MNQETYVYQNDLLEPEEEIQHHVPYMDRAAR